MPGKKNQYCREALTREALALFPKFGRFKTFYLAGGTALALQIGHRISVDFDFFFRKRTSAKLVAKNAKNFPQHINKSHL